ncbi:hypothetical protein THICB1_10153 [Thiomonas arsenitoxydans]|uniref:Uncharacterized protein n=1 Tax=Thiomonas arsenitoxydans (strain DSM 22701 / CIP 110005 / 3As) TaxID=426114 RepID=A0ABP1YZX2_THIA3|nr:hypothetical protein THICB2_730010 [Thiomonas sp. CB2]CQR26410.1 hypothetical protein THICB1_10153 [Thiomonas arsenitoxydans]CQR44238.1 hypothetical protein THICB3490085 [Thiomonas sp. CB3]VDY07099.1 protein of unknown function [Thiomonas sp. Bio17B3]VDY09605.1 protein of unknown function [Thiomonas sp. Sup16B3]VDY15373.1 conserved protein of unknown function [Thiomonas sp. OC7]
MTGVLTCFKSDLIGVTIPSTGAQIVSTGFKSNPTGVSTGFKSDLTAAQIVLTGVSTANKNDLTGVTIQASGQQTSAG